MMICGIGVILWLRWMHLMNHFISVFRYVVLVLTVLLISLDHGKLVGTGNGFLSFGTSSDWRSWNRVVLIRHDTPNILNRWKRHLLLLLLLVTAITWLIRNYSRGRFCQGENVFFLKRQALKVQRLSY